MTSMVNPQTLKTWLHDGKEIALFDVREFGQFSNAHIFLASNLPYSRLEIEILRLVPHFNVRVVLCDDGYSNVSTLAAQRLTALGYTNVWLLEGGNAAWASSGFKLFGGVNVPSKTFGELVEQVHHTPQISASELVRMRERGEDFIVLDGRPYDEYQQMNIPGASCCPNGELAYRIQHLAPNESTKIVINCAGRTRSLIGAQTLINFGVKNPVYALENGTQGWFLADFPLQYGSQDCYPTLESRETQPATRQAAERLALRYEVPLVDSATLCQWLQDDDCCLFLCDVRTEEEFLAGSLPGAQHTPGGQLVQATDEFVGVRNARVVLFDSEHVRALVTASWLKQMGWQVYVLEEGMNAVLPGVDAPQDALPSLQWIGCGEAAEGLASGQLIAYDLRSSTQYHKLHAENSIWSIRPSLLKAASGLSLPVVLIADDPRVARLAGGDLLEAGATDVRILRGGFDAWLRLGLPTESTPENPAYADCIDYLFFEHQLQESKEAARRYLTWEIDLTAQLDQEERSIFKLKA
jgi:rhodanese-related sulfurtransferase